MLAVASRLCGLHAQVLSSAELTVWARVEGLERGEVQRALWEERSLVKTWAMRGTLHLLPASELRLWHAGLGLNPRYLRPRLWQRNFGISMEELHALTKAVGTALDGRLMTREDLAREVSRICRSRALGKNLANNSWGTMLRPAAFSGLLCFGPSVGQRVQFTRPDTWLGSDYSAADAHDGQAAAAAITRRYLAAYGPATPYDMAVWWGGGGITAARKWIALLGDDAAEVDVEGTKMWMLAKDYPEAKASAASRLVKLLPGFDQYVVVSSRHADHLMSEGVRARIYRPQGWISPVLLVNGRMEGTWRHEATGSRVDITIEPFGKVPAWVRRAAEEEAERLGAFLGGAARVQWN